MLNRVENAHLNYIKTFVESRKVPLPEFIVNDYENNYVTYEYMDQIDELQSYFGLLDNYVWLWNRYEFSFYQIRLASDIKARLSDKINSILAENRFDSNKKKKGGASESAGPSYSSFEIAKSTKSTKSTRPKTAENKTKERPKFISQMIKR